MAETPKKFAFKNEATVSGLVTPVGVMAFPKLLEPDGKFNPDNPSYSVSLRYKKTDKAAQELISKIEAAHAEALAFVQATAPPTYDSKGQPKPIKEADLPCGVWMEKTPDGTKVPTDEIFIKFKSGSVYRKGDVVKKITLNVRDGQRNPWPRNVEIGGGSTGRAFFTINPFFVPAFGVGVSLRLDAVQVQHAKSYGSVAMDNLSDSEIPEVFGMGETGEETGKTGPVKGGGDF